MKNLFIDPVNYQEEVDSNNPFDNVFPKVIVGYAGITNALEPFIETIKLLKDSFYASGKW